ncbi:helix-turn-helix domain-containing protein [Blautia ammoniilytica]|uniref:Helix-turn-helix domain-containing protein n=1 Tax=Blautia ammoniilytica TaxID=2981782 RepID=A0ABT2TYQ2_9FIRM|nr:helix-turn-helix transcriptional regulator [Blautia ammoniilytica]MCU6766574.1 helix-turn-helix domain-containing protein [Blautia ammoniilytica]SCI68833.1 putative zinc finger/helix-turn-helix protein%2C YgiT family [uncultured Blautia sp.]
MNKVKDSNQNIAKAVLKIRQDNKLSQEQFAEMAGVTRQAVSRWEMGVSVPNINALILISEKFDIPVDEMLKSGDVVEKMISIVTMLPVPSGKTYQIKYRPLYTKLCRGSIIK